MHCREMTGLADGSYVTLVFRITQVKHIYKFEFICQNNWIEHFLFCAHTFIIHLYLQLRARAPQTSFSARPPCTASPNCGFVMKTPTVQMGQTRLIAVSCGNPPINHISSPKLNGEESDLIWINFTLGFTLVWALFLFTAWLCWGRKPWRTAIPFCQ